MNISKWSEAPAHDVTIEPTNPGMAVSNWQLKLAEEKAGILLRTVVDGESWGGKGQT